MAGTYVAQIIQKIADILDAAGKPTGLEVVVSRKRNPPTGAGVKIATVFPMRDEKASSSEKHSRIFQGTRRILTVTVECRTAGTDLDNEVLRAWVVEQIMVLLPASGLVADVEEGTTEWRGDQDSNADYSEAPIEFLVEYARSKNSLEKP